MGSKEYEREQFDRLQTVVNAACQNPSSRSDVHISTQGTDLSASDRIALSWMADQDPQLVDAARERFGLKE